LLDSWEGERAYGGSRRGFVHGQVSNNLLLLIINRISLSLSLVITVCRLSFTRSFIHHATMVGKLETNLYYKYTTYKS